MNQAEVNRFKKLYQRHLRLLKLQGKSQKTIDAYSRAVRRISEHFDCCPDQLTPEQLEIYFGELVDTHSWSTVKIDRNGLQFYWRLKPSSYSGTARPCQPYDNCTLYSSD